MPVNKILYSGRERCYTCYRPKSSCLCSAITAFDTDTKFIILMHPKEFKKTKNTTGRLTHLTLKNSELFIGIDFTNHSKINDIISTHNSFVLYPSKEVINLSTQKPSLDKKMAIFLIDSTWACSKSMLRESKNLQKLQKISFDNTKLSQYKIKEQPAEYCLSTIESTLTVLSLLNKHNIEKIDNNNLENFLNPFHKMVDYQITCISKSNKNSVRFKKYF